MELIKRQRRLRKNRSIRKLVRETELSINDIVQPLFVVNGENVAREIEGMPDNYHYSIDNLLDEVGKLATRGIKAIMLFGIPEYRDKEGSSAWQSDGIVQRAVKEIKSNFRDILVITDLCFCQYTEHGHCGYFEKGEVKNDITLENLTKVALSHAAAGADMVAPSDMMDGRVKRIRNELDEMGFINTGIMAYSAKYHSFFYGPFRNAADSAPKSGDRSTYQMDTGNSDEALREIELDIEEGADIVMIKPALSYLDIINRVNSSYQIPLAAYNVSGEYSMVKAAADRGWINEKEVALEILTSIKRAGADIIISYWAKDIPDWL
ncbi:MAG: porphobilinogen synthase [Halanaerobiales bacterium]